MPRPAPRRRLSLLFVLLGPCLPMPAQDPGGVPPERPGFAPGGPPGFEGPGFGGPGGPGGMGRAPQQIAERFDADENGRLDRQERDAARQWLGENGQRRGGPGGGPGGRRGGRRVGPGPMGGTEAGKPGPRLSPADVDSHAGKALYDPSILRTLFLQFEADNWETELEAFYNTDVDVPATLAVDGKSYADVGVPFRGNSSYFGVPKGNKRSLNLDLDAVHKGQKLGGYKTLNLLNAHEDASFLHEALHAAIGRQFVPVPQSNLVRVVVNASAGVSTATASRPTRTTWPRRSAAGRARTGRCRPTSAAAPRCATSATISSSTGAVTKPRAASTTTPGGGWSNCAGSCRRATTRGCCATCHRSSTSMRPCGSWRSTTRCSTATAI